jgi:(E)-4-hydroxy-3-methylbut-2-enyl-diphosphate synthase
MTNTDTRDPSSTLAQINSCASRGAEVVRISAPDMKAAMAISEIVPHSPIPVVADIHFDYRLALQAIAGGVAGLRLNPGNIGSSDKIRLVAEAAGKAGAAIRVGVNLGSLEAKMVALYGDGPLAMVESALAQIAVLQETGFNDIKVSLKASSVMETVKAVRLFAERSDIAQHLGITESGDVTTGSIRSAVGLGILLSEGLGDTIRVSLTGPPEDEVDCAWEILKSLKLRARGPEFISCPTCGRCEIDLAALLKDVKQRLSFVKKPLTIAVMGCVVNGPGEAKRADVGIAGGRGSGRLFFKGLPCGTYPFEQLASVLEDKVRELESQ